MLVLMRSSQINLGRWWNGCRIFRIWSKVTSRDENTARFCVKVVTADPPGMTRLG